MASTHPIYRFGRCEVDPRLRQVRLGGVVAESQPRAFDLLLYLIERRDRVVDKDELLAALWPGSVVSESALAQAVRKARSLIGDDGSRQALIRTVQRRGFRFVGELEQEASSAQPHESSVAVLPFVDMSPQRDQEYFCDGMAEEIINELSRIPELRVAARTSAFAFKHRTDDVREIGRRLGVATVLEGSVRKSGERLRVTAQLVDARTGFHRWSDRWDRRLEDMLAIQDEIASRIAAALRKPRGTKPGPDGGAEALYLRGRSYLLRSGQRSQRFALELFKLALAVDPAHARACAGLAIGHVALSRPVTDEHLEAAERAAAQALELDPECPQAWTALGVARSAAADFAAAEQAFERALELAPDLFEARFYYGHACLERGDYARAAALYERAAELEPNDYQALVFAGQAYRSLHDPEKARDTAMRQLAAAEKALAADPTDARALSLGACSLIFAGREREAREWIARAGALEPDEPYVHYNAACFFARLGDTERALGELECIDSKKLCRLPWIEHDEDLDAIRDHPRFRALFYAKR